MCCPLARFERPRPTRLRPRSDLSYALKPFSLSPNPFEERAKLRKRNYNGISAPVLASTAKFFTTVIVMLDAIGTVVPAGGEMDRMTPSG